MALHADPPWGRDSVVRRGLRESCCQDRPLLILTGDGGVSSADQGLALSSGLGLVYLTAVHTSSPLAFSRKLFQQAFFAVLVALRKSRRAALVAPAAGDIQDLDVVRCSAPSDPSWR